MQEDISIWGLIDRPISVTEASILWCDVHPADFFSPAKAEIWVTNTYEYDQIYPRIAKFFEHREEPLKIRKILERAILEKELPAYIWDCPPACVYPYENFNHDLTTVLIDDLAAWAINKGLSPRFLQLPIAKFKRTKNIESSEEIKSHLKPQHKFIKETVDNLVKSNNKFPTYKEVIKKMIHISMTNEDDDEYDGLLIEDPPSEKLWSGSVEIIFHHSKKGGEISISTKTIKNYLTTLRKEYNNNL